MRVDVTRASALRWVAAFLALGALAPSAEPLPTGASRRTVELDGMPIEVHAYKPASYRGDALLLSFHGLSRNVEAYLEATTALAERHGLLVVLPLFDRERFPYWRYQALGITRQSRKNASGPVRVEPSESWTSRIIARLIDHVRREEGRPDLPYYVIGHSAGGQIANRLAAFAVQGAKRIVVANPSSYVAPTRTARFPYGFGGLPAHMSDDTALQRYLAQPITIFIGSADVLGRNLDRLPPAMAQGATRYERGLNVYRAAQETARARGWTFNWRLVEAPGIGHDAGGMYRSPQADAALFSDRSP